MPDVRGELIKENGKLGVYILKNINGGKNVDLILFLKNIYILIYYNFWMTVK